MFDVIGCIENIENARVADLEAIQKAFYNPESTAIFIYGDVNEYELKKVVSAIFGSWKSNAIKKPSLVQSKAKHTETEIAVIQDDTLCGNHSYVKLNFRSPNGAVDFSDTYTAEYLKRLLDEEEVQYGKILDKKFLFSRFKKETASTRFNFTNSFLFYMDFKADKNLVRHSLSFLEVLRKKILTKIMNEKSYFSQDMKSRCVNSFLEDYELDYEVSKSLLQNFAYFWALKDEYYLSDFPQNMQKTDVEAMRYFIEKYFFESEPLIEIFVSAETMRKYESQWQKQGISIVKDNSFAWWNEKEKRESIAETEEIQSRVEQESVYSPTSYYDYKGHNCAILGEIDERELSNGIKVYIQKDSSKEKVGLTFVIEGGCAHLGENESGLEDEVLNVMATSSRKWRKKKRNAFLRANNSKIRYMSCQSYSLLQLTSDSSSEFFSCLPLFTDGIQRPYFDTREIAKRKDEAKEEIATFFASSDNALFYEMSSKVYRDNGIVATAYLTNESRKNISSKVLKKIYKRILNAHDIFIVATGNVDTERLIDFLESSVAKIKAADNKNPLFDIKIRNTQSVKIHHRECEYAPLVFRAFETNCNSPNEYAALLLATDIYNVALHNVVREKYGVCYSANCNSIGKDYFCNAFFALSEQSKFNVLDSLVKEAITEAKSYCTEKKLLNGCKKWRILTIASEYEGVKDKGLQIAENVAFWDNPYWSEELSLQIEDCSEEDVLRAFESVIETSPSRYFIAE